MLKDKGAFKNYISTLGSEQNSNTWKGDGAHWAVGSSIGKLHTSPKYKQIYKGSKFLFLLFRLKTSIMTRDCLKHFWFVIERFSIENLRKFL